MKRSDLALRAFARVLPREFRERVFDPALSALRRDEMERPATENEHTLRRMLFTLECVRLLAPFLLWRRGRPTRLASTLILILGAAAVVVQHVRYEGPHERAGVHQDPPSRR
jgi:hypothetical protein